jgi:hypothetical protein
MRKDLIISDEIPHLIMILKFIRSILKKSCGDSKKSRKEAFKHIFHHHDVFSITTPLLLSED